MAREEMEAEGAKGSMDASIRAAKKAARPRELGMSDAPRKQPRKKSKSTPKQRSSLNVKQSGKSSAVGKSGFRSDMGSHKRGRR